jgi:hypothetical protein
VTWQLSGVECGGFLDLCRDDLDIRIVDRECVVSLRAVEQWMSESVQIMAPCKRCSSSLGRSACGDEMEKEARANLLDCSLTLSSSSFCLKNERHSACRQ